MEYLFFALILLAGYHLFMENVVVPSYQLKLKEHFFTLFTRINDEIDKTKKGQLLSLMKEIQHAMVVSCVSIESHNYIAYKLYTRKLSPGIRKKLFDMGVEKRALIAKQGSDELKKLIVDYRKAVDEAFTVNNYGWLLYLLPIISFGEILLRPFRKKSIHVVTKKIATERFQEYIKYERQTEQPQKKAILPNMFRAAAAF